MVVVLLFLSCTIWRFKRRKEGPDAPLAVLRDLTVVPLAVQ